MKGGVAVMITRDGKILLGKRKGAHGAGTWSFPGGKPEAGESDENAVKRETKEECGLELTNLQAFASNIVEFEEINEVHQTRFFTANALPGQEPVLLEPNKCEEWRWFGWDEVPRPLFEPVRNLFESFEQGYQFE